ncbi:MAG: hypothetical protein Q8R05_02800 [Candidatus Omnitrophota bacterium]|nr:hypothetical protein [Candidatus Omnitrophota bacterium]
MKKIIAFVVTGIFLLQGCATTEGIKKLEEQGSKQVFAANFEKVWEAARFACSNSELTINEANKDQGYISASAPLRPQSWGELVGIWVSKKTDNSTEVKVVSRRVGPALLFWYNWEKPVLEAIDAYIKSHP